MNTTFLRDAEGKPIGILGVTRDISERKRAEETLRTKDSAIASSISAMALADLDGNLTYVNPSTLKMWGYDDEKEMLGRPIHRFWQAREKALEVGEALRDKGSWMGEMVAIRRDGSLFDVDMSASTVTDEAGNPICMMGSFLDVTERKRAEEALRESEEKYRSLVQDATDGIAIVEGLEVRFVNRTLLEMYGGESEEEMVGRPLTDFVTPEHRELMVERSYARGKGQDAPDHYEFRALRKDGTEFDAELSVSLITYEGKVARQGLIRDVTERKRMDDALRESEARYRLLAENASDLIWTMDLSLRYTYMSPAVTRMRGYSVDEIVGTTIQETMTPASLETARKALAEELALERTGQADPSRSRKIELEMCCKDGSTIWTEMNTTFLRDAEGKPIGILGVTRDISERKRAEEALRESEMRFRQVAESSRGWIWEADSEGRYTYSSPVVKDVLGYEPEEVIGKRYHDFFTPEDREQLLPAAEVAFARKEAFFRLINRNVHKEGHVVVLETTAVPMLDAEGNLLGYRGVDQDVTGREKAQEEQQRLHAELKTQAITDSPTGLYNHAHFYERLAHEVERSGRYGHRFALVVMDVDAFKHYNDSRGHQAGDDALRLVAECIQSAMRRSDLAFRYGGDEFVAILLDADVSKAQDIVRRINRSITARLKELGDPAGEWLGVSAGVACFPEDATTADELVSLADLAMYDAKRLAWARGVMGRARLGGPAGGPAGGPVGGPAVWVAETVHETQTKALSGATSELAAALQDLTAPQVLSEEDLRTLAALSAAAEIKDPYIHGHQERISRLAATVAREMGLSPDRVRNVTTAGLLHDLGKVNVGEGILNKPGKLSESEFAEVKEHASFGEAMIVSGIGGLQPLAPIVRHHHERFDGNGYPDGLAREDIPLEARILSVADAFDAMTHERAYRKALSTEEALGEIQRAAGTLFDGAVVEAFLGVMMRGSGSG
jgi:diguanylate cyclase (GGDEF)-like protein/PAS domain S-box-containing protein